MSPLQGNSVPLNISLLDIPLLLRGLLAAWAAVRPASSLAWSSGLLLLGDKVGRRSMGEGMLLGASRGFGRNPGWKGCSLSVVVSLVVYSYMLLKNLWLFWLSFICRNSRGGFCFSPSLSGSWTLSPCPLPAMFPSPRPEPVGLPAWCTPDVGCEGLLSLCLKSRLKI